VRAGFIEDEINQMRAGNTATVTIFPAAKPDRPVILTVSLTGFTKGFEAITRIFAGTTE